MAQKRSTNKAAQRKAAAEAKVTNTEETTAPPKPKAKPKEKPFILNPGAVAAAAAPAHPRAQADRQKRFRELDPNHRDAIQRVATGEPAPVPETPAARAPRAIDPAIVKSLASRIASAKNSDEVMGILTNRDEGSSAVSKPAMFAQEGLYDATKYTPQQLTVIHNQAIAHYTQKIKGIRSRSGLPEYSEDELADAVSRNRFLHDSPLDYLKGHFVEPSLTFGTKGSQEGK